MNLECRWRGRWPYAEALDAQRERRRAVLQGEAAEVVWTLEHPAVITVGRRALMAAVDRDAAAAAGVPVQETERGGLATVHAPGQLVAYLILDLRRRRLTIPAMVAGMEAAMIDVVATLGVKADRRPGTPGVWVGGEKIGAVGLHIEHGVSMHGLALNLSPDLSLFGLIVPCGIADAGVCSVKSLMGAAPSPEDMAPALTAALKVSLGLLDGPQGGH
jgi:lipoyl(octanoyl) transferase